MKIKLLCSERAQSEIIKKSASEAIRELGLEASVEMILDAKDILRHGVVRTPALILDGRLRVQGKNISVEDFKDYLSEQ